MAGCCCCLTAAGSSAAAMLAVVDPASCVGARLLLTADPGSPSQAALDVKLPGWAPKPFACIQACKSSYTGAVGTHWLYILMMPRHLFLAKHATSRMPPVGAQMHAE